MELTKEDFASAFLKLLPPGEYWNLDRENEQLKQLVNAIGEELKAVHDETELNLSFEINNQYLGWKLSDFQQILDNNSINGQVTDKVTNPNVIYLTLYQTVDVLTVFDLVEAHRLPHTQIAWTFTGALRINGAIRAANFVTITFEE